MIDRTDVRISMSIKDMHDDDKADNENKSKFIPFQKRPLMYSIVS